MRKLLTLLIFLSATTSFAQFDTADYYFSLRENSVENIDNARSAYMHVARDAQGEQLAYSVQQIGRLALYEADYLSVAGDEAKLKEIFSQCRDLAGRLEPYQPQYKTQYAYWKMTCTSNWLLYATIGERLGALPGIKRHFNLVVDESLNVREDAGLDLRYEGGGISRVLAAIYTNSLSNLLRNDLPNQDKALEMIDQAIDSSPYPGTTLYGADFYRNHSQKAQILYNSERNSDAEDFILETIEELDELIDEDALPEGLEPESKGERQKLEELLQ